MFSSRSHLYDYALATATLLAVVILCVGFLSLTLFSNSTQQKALAKPIGQIQGFQRTYQTTIYSGGTAVPRVISLHNGDMLRLINSDTKNHQLSQISAAGSDNIPKGGLITRDLAPGETYKISFPTPGTYFFKDFRAPQTILTIIVG